jgi:hydrogenase expression/formation protein HypE
MKPDVVLAAHGGGGEMTRRLLEERVLPKLSNPVLDALTDGAVMPAVQGRICFTTDAHVVQPLEFPGGDIGRLAVCGTVNDLAMMGAKPLALSLALVLEEGLSLATLERILDSIAAAAKEACVPIVAGDTKVVEHGRGDGMHVTTAGIGVVREGLAVGAERIRPGDAVILSGNIAEHGLAVMVAREKLGIATSVRSDVAPLAEMVERILDSGADVRFLRDPTRGGLAGVVADLAEASGLTIEVNEEDVPLTPAARHIAELLGLDPLTVANEGKLVAVVGAADVDRTLAACRASPYGARAAVIGRVVESTPPLAELATRAGGRRIIMRPYGAELPRIC